MHVCMSVCVHVYCVVYNFCFTYRFMCVHVFTHVLVPMLQKGRQLTALRYSEFLHHSRVHLLRH